jgi:hypothetical protein
MATAAVANYLRRAPLKEGLAIAGSSGAVAGMLFAVDTIDAICG